MKPFDRGTALLAIGAALGVVVAALGIIEGESAASTAVPDGAVAVVNGAPILQSDYQRALRALAADLREDPLPSAARRRVLERLIEQELLVQRGLELGLAERDPRIRATLTDAVIGSLVARGQPPATAPTEEEMRAFHAEHPAYFRTTARLKLQRLWFSDRQSGRARARRRAQVVARRLAAGERFEAVSGSADTHPAPLPADWLPLAKVADYLGADAAATAAALPAGQRTEPLRVAGGYAVIRVVGRKDGRTQPFEQVRAQVAAQLRRRQDDQALRSFLAERRRAARITIAEERL